MQNTMLNSWRATSSGGPERSLRLKEARSIATNEMKWTLNPGMVPGLFDIAASSKYIPSTRLIAIQHERFSSYDVDDPYGMGFINYRDPKMLAEVGFKRWEWFCKYSKTPLVGGWSWYREEVEVSRIGFCLGYIRADDGRMFALVTFNGGKTVIRAYPGRLLEVTT